MTTACVAIIIIVLISSFMCTRHGYRAIVSIVTAVDVAALVAGAAIVIVSAKPFFRRKATRRSYCIALIAFMAILTLALLVNFYGEL